MSDRLAAILLQLAEGVSRHHWFSRYSYREELPQHGMVSIMRHWMQYDPVKGDNPHAYFTTAFFRSYRSFCNDELEERVARDIIRKENGLAASYHFESDDRVDEPAEDIDTPGEGTDMRARMEENKRLAQELERRRIDDPGRLGRVKTFPQSYVFDLDAIHLDLSDTELNHLLKFRLKAINIQPLTITWRFKGKTLAITPVETP